MSDRPLPGWPRGLSAPLAAGYVGLSLTTFRREVAAGRAPAPVSVTIGRQVWLREDLDRWLDGRAGRPAASSAENPWLARLQRMEDMSEETYWSWKPGMRREILRDFLRRREKQRYNATVSQTFEDFERSNRRQLLDRKAEVQLAAKQKL